MKILFLGTPQIACGFLRRLAAAGHELCGVITQPDRPSGRGLSVCCSPVAGLAAGLCVPVLKPESRDALHEAVASLSPDLGVAVAYGRLIPERTLALARHGFINVHFSLLPKYRGAAPVQRALINGEKVTGVTIFWLDKGMDTGPVLLRREVPVESADDAASLFAKLSAAGEELLAEALPLIAAGAAPRQPQEGEPSLAPMLGPADAELDFSRPAAELNDRVRGLALGPRARFRLRAEGRPPLAVQVLEAAPASAGEKGAPGELLSVERGGGFIVKCGGGALLVKTVKPEGKKAMRGSDFLNGLRLGPGDRLG